MVLIYEEKEQKNTLNPFLTNIFKAFLPLGKFPTIQRFPVLSLKFILEVEGAVE
jgi:hypothetical protein